MKLRRSSGSGSEGAERRQVNSLEGGRAVRRLRSDLGRTRGWMRGLAGKLDYIQYSRFLVHWQCWRHCVKLQAEVQLRRWR